MSDPEIVFEADKIVIHHWPKDTPEWSKERKHQISQFVSGKKKILVSGKSVRINDLEFESLKKIGITIPLFDKQFTMIFEGHCQEFDAHVHITCKTANYLEPFNQLMKWRKSNFQG